MVTISMARSSPRLPPRTHLLSLLPPSIAPVVTDHSEHSDRSDCSNHADLSASCSMVKTKGPFVWGAIVAAKEVFPHAVQHQCMFTHWSSIGHLLVIYWSFIGIHGQMIEHRTPAR